MVNVFFTVDVEVWLDGWQNLDAKFADGFRKYIYGPTPDGEWGLPLQLKAMNDYGMTGMFFVEPLFSYRFGLQPLSDIVGLLEEAGQNVQLHLHTEWLDEIYEKPLFPKMAEKKQFIRYFSREEQAQILEYGRQRLLQAGASRSINAFRAGSFEMNYDTLCALSDLGIPYDFSYNHTLTRHDSVPTSSGAELHRPFRVGDVIELPMSLYTFSGGRQRHLQLGACSFEEIRSVLLQAVEQEWDSVVILSHNFEMLDHATKSKRDDVVAGRFINLLKFLNNNSDLFTMKADPSSIQTCEQQPELPTVAWPAVAKRNLEQAWRRLY